MPECWETDVCSKNPEYESILDKRMWTILRVEAKKVQRIFCKDALSIETRKVSFWDFFLSLVFS